MSSLRDALQGYLSLRRSLGYKMLDEARQLPRFVAFLEERSAAHITVRLALQWAQQTHAQPAEWARRLCFVRGFARYCSATDALTEVPPVRLMPYRSTRAKPYLYTDDELQRLLSAARELPTHWPSTPLRPWVLHCLFGLLAAKAIVVIGELLCLAAQASVGTCRHCLWQLDCNSNGVRHHASEDT